jgi:hypothetical protein
MEGSRRVVMFSETEFLLYLFKHFLYHVCGAIDRFVIFVVGIHRWDWVDGEGEKDVLLLSVWQRHGAPCWRSLNSALSMILVGSSHSAFISAYRLSFESSMFFGNDRIQAVLKDPFSIFVYHVFLNISRISVRKSSFCANLSQHT